jgi:hypothetical protein
MKFQQFQRDKQIPNEKEDNLALWQEKKSGSIKCLTPTYV